MQEKPSIMKVRTASSPKTCVSGKASYAPAWHLLLCLVVGAWGVTACRSAVSLRSEAGTGALAAPFLMVLGVAQDGGYPQAGCEKACCRVVREGRAPVRSVTGLALVDPTGGSYWLFEATPDIGRQMGAVWARVPSVGRMPKGIFLTHAHIGHYAGLMQLGREVMGARAIPVHAMPRMRGYLSGNGPWSQLVSAGNIELRPMVADSGVDLPSGVRVTPFLVPHRDEYSETVGYRIEGPSQRVLFIPDIDKWERWGRDITDALRGCDLALVDGTFFDGTELPGRDMREIPHPSVTESMARFAPLPDSLRRRVCFIHFNHTNPLLRHGSRERQAVGAAGYRVAEEGMLIGL